MPDVPFRDNVWPKFLRENAQRVFKLPEKKVPRMSAEAFEKARAEVGVIDTMIGFPAPREEQAKQYDFIRKQTHDADSQEWEFPAQYMFKGVPHYDQVDDPVEMLLAKMDQHGITQGAHRDGRRRQRQDRARALSRPLPRVDEHRSEPGHGRGAQARRGRARARRPGRATAGAPASSRRCR